MKDKVLLNKDEYNSYKQWCATELKKDEVSDEAWEWCSNNKKPTVQYYKEKILNIGIFLFI